MSRNLANFALSQECDFSFKNFSGSVSPMLEIENVGNFLFDASRARRFPCTYAWAVFLHLSSIGFLRPSIKSGSGFSLRIFCIKLLLMIATLILAGIIYGIFKIIISYKNGNENEKWSIQWSSREQRAKAKEILAWKESVGCGSLYCHIPAPYV